MSEASKRDWRTEGVGESARDIFRTSENVKQDDDSGAFGKIARPARSPRDTQPVSLGTFLQLMCPFLS